MYVMTSRTPVFVKKFDLDLDPWALDPQSPPDFFLKLAAPTAFSPQILRNTITPCVQLEYLREIRRHSIKKSV